MSMVRPPVRGLIRPMLQGLVPAIGPGVDYYWGWEAGKDDLTAIYGGGPFNGSQVVWGGGDNVLVSSADQVPVSYEEGVPYLVQHAANVTNTVNNELAGAAVGNVIGGALDGSFPTGWYGSGTGVLSTAIVDVLSIDLANREIRFRFRFTNTSGATAYPLLHFASPIAAATGQQWLAQCDVKVLQSFTSGRFMLRLQEDGGSAVNYDTDIPQSASSKFFRALVDNAVLSDPGTTGVDFLLRWRIDDGQSIDTEIVVRMPQATTTLTRYGHAPGISSDGTATTLLAQTALTASFPAISGPASLYWEGKFNDVTGANRFYASVADSIGQNHLLLFWVNSSQLVRMNMTGQGSSNTIDFIPPPPFNTRVKALLVLEAGSTRGYMNGVGFEKLVGNDPQNLKDFHLGYWDGSVDNRNGRHHKVRVYDRALTEEEAIKITTV